MGNQVFPYRHPQFQGDTITTQKTPSIARRVAKIVAGLNIVMVLMWFRPGPRNLQASGD